MFQEVTIIGNLGQDPELRYLDSGTPVANFSVATNRRWTNKDGSQGEETVWFRITAWRRMAEVCNEYLKTGRQVFVKGRLRPDPETGGPQVWHGKDGEPRASYEVTANLVKFLGSRGDAPAKVEEDEIPF